MKFDSVPRGLPGLFGTNVVGGVQAIRSALGLKKHVEKSQPTPFQLPSQICPQRGVAEVHVSHNQNPVLTRSTTRSYFHGWDCPLTFMYPGFDCGCNLSLPDSPHSSPLHTAGSSGESGGFQQPRSLDTACETRPTLERSTFRCPLTLDCVTKV